MLKIDSHQHFWKYDPIKDGWITDEMYILQKDFLATDIEPLLHNYSFDGCISVQADQSEAENDFLLEQADNNAFIKGIVGWVNLTAGNVEERLAYYSQFEKIKGFRYILQGERNRAFMLQPEFMKGIAVLGKYNFTYDILIAADQLQFIPALVKKFPNQLFVIDHLAKPLIKEGQIKEWEKYIRALAVYENVFCKVSGMLTEAKWTDWKKSDLYPYLNIVFEAFDAKRVMYGSDWPVCRLAATYGEVLSVMSDYTANLSQHEWQLFWGKNASDFYKI